jgi:hypothetical protein
MRTIFISAMAITASVAAFACSGGGALDESGVELGDSSQELMLTDPIWDNNTSSPKGSRIRVCYKYLTDQTHGVTAAAAATHVAEIRNTIENTWGRVANLTFWDWGLCATSDTSRAIVLTIGKGIGNAKGGGAPGTVTIDLDVNQAGLPYIAGHEFGHALSFSHEFNRSDWTCPHNGDGSCMKCTKDADCTNGANFGVACVNTFCRKTSGTLLSPEPDYDSVTATTYISSNRTTNTKPASPINTLSAYDIVGVQAIYGRKPPGSLVGLGGRCMTVAGGSTSWGTGMVAQECANTTKDTWQYFPASKHLQSNLQSSPGVSANECLNISGGTVNPNGSTPLINWGCGNYSNEAFSFEGVQLRAMGNMCVAAAATNGAAVTVEYCDGTAPGGKKREWNVISRDVPMGDLVVQYTAFQLAGTSYCITVGNTNYGTGAVLRSCTNTAYRSQQAFSTSGGVLRTSANSGRCLNVSGGTDNPGASVVIWDGCNPDIANEFFYLSGMVKGLGQCVDMLGGVSYDNASIGMWPCVATAPNHNWDYYWR